MATVTKTENESKGLEVREGRTELIVPHLGERLVFVYPAKGPDTYFRIAEQLQETDLQQPTMEETASLVYAAWQNPDNKYSRDIIKKLKDFQLWGFTGILYVPDEGAYIQDNPEVREGRIYMDKEALEKRLKKGDSRVRYVESGAYRTGQQSGFNLERNQFVQALAGKEGAKKLAEVASKYRYSPYLVLENTIEESTAVSALEVAQLYSYSSGWLDSGLQVLCCSEAGLGFAFGVSRRKSGLPAR